MVYLDYELLKTKYLETLERYDEIIGEKETLWQITQPKAIQTDKEKVDGGGQSNPFDTYLIKKEQQHIDEKLMEIKSVLKERKELLKIMEEDLRNSKALHDRIYRMRYLDHWRVTLIAQRVGYSESQIYRILEMIDLQIKDARKCEK